MKENTNQPSAVVVDASAIIARLFPDEKQPQSVISAFNLFTHKKLDFVAPALIEFEFGNALKSGVLQKRHTQAIASKILAAFQNLHIKFKPIDPSLTLQLAIKHRLSFYDASYVYLANSLKLPLLSLDKRLTHLTN